MTVHYVCRIVNGQQVYVFGPVASELEARDYLDRHFDGGWWVITRTEFLPQEHKP